MTHKNGSVLIRLSTRLTNTPLTSVKRGFFSNIIDHQQTDSTPFKYFPQEVEIIFFEASKGPESIRKKPENRPKNRFTHLKKVVDKYRESDILA